MNERRQFLEWQRDCHLPASGSQDLRRGADGMRRWTPAWRLFGGEGDSIGVMFVGGCATPLARFAGALPVEEVTPKFVRGTEAALLVTHTG